MLEIVALARLEAVCGSEVPCVAVYRELQLVRTSRWCVEGICNEVRSIVVVCCSVLQCGAHVCIVETGLQEFDECETCVIKRDP